MTDLSLMPDSHLDLVLDCLTRGRLIFFIGAGANLCDSPGGTWTPERRDRLPKATELSSHLRDRFKLIDVDESADLAHVAQHVVLRKGGYEPLYDEIRRIFLAAYPLTHLHRLLASIPAILRKAGHPRIHDPETRRLVLISTNYDDLLEQAFTNAGHAFHTLVYEAAGDHDGQFLYRSPSGKERFLSSPRQTRVLIRDSDPIIVKFHGGLHRDHSSRDSLVISEDHYIDYLTRTDVSDLLPHPLPSLLTYSHFLFLGHALRDWNLRVIFHRLWQKSKLKPESWAIQHPAAEFDIKFWQRMGVTVFSGELAHYMPLLEERLNSLA